MPPIEHPPGMFHDVIGWMTSLIVHYGLAGLFISSILGSTIFIPFSVEAVLPVMVGLKLDLVQIVVVATVGATIGTSINYAIGFYATELVEKRLGEENLKKAKHLMDKHGWPGLFLILAAPIPLPIPVDPLTVIPGLAKMNYKEFVIVVLCAKLIKYTFFVAVSTGLINLLHI
ncbi:MAG: VTT domain-containing protein [Candidatus Altiarchaeia archaeon]